MSERDTEERERFVSGVWYAISAFGLWGLLPLYWKALGSVPSSQILCHRIVWSCLFVFILNRTGRRRSLQLWTERTAGRFFLSLLRALFLGTNFYIYIWAVNADKVVETSMGYFITPLINVMLGMLILRERLSIWQMVSLALVFAGVLHITVEYGRLPWVALSLAFTFGLYGLLRKTARVDSLRGLFFETAVLSPAAMVFLFLQQIRGAGAFGTAPVLVHALLVGSGVVTALPLVLFAKGARRLPLSTVGFIQYLAPILLLFLGAVVFGEPFTITHLVSFSLIWTALLLYTLSHTRICSALTRRAWRLRLLFSSRRPENGGEGS